MQHQHARKRALSAVELSWVHTLIAHSDDTPATLVTSALATPTPTAPNAPPASKAEQAQRRKLANRKSASEARYRRTQHIQSLLARIDELKHERVSLLLKVQLATDENSLLKQDIPHARDRTANRSW